MKKNPIQDLIDRLEKVDYAIADIKELNDFYNNPSTDCAVDDRIKALRDARSYITMAQDSLRDYEFCKEKEL